MAAHDRDCRPGDVFDVAPSRFESMFSTVQNFVTALEQDTHEVGADEAGAAGDQDRAVHGEPRRAAARNSTRRCV